MSRQETAQNPEQSAHDLAVRNLEHAVEAEPENIEYYLELGIAYILSGREEEAQTTWLCGLAQVEEIEISQWTIQLIQRLDFEAQCQAEQLHPQVSWLLRQHLRELAPAQTNNLLLLLQLELQLDQFTPAILTEWRVMTSLQQCNDAEFDAELLLEVLAKLLQFPSEEVLAFVDACLTSPKLANDLARILYDIAYEFAARHRTNFDFVASLLERVTRLEPTHRVAWQLMAGCYQRLKQFDQAIVSAQRHFQRCETLSERYAGSCLLERIHLTAGMWKGLDAVMSQNHNLLQKLLTEKSTQLDFATISCLISDPAHFLYLQDDLAENRRWQNQAAQLFYQNIQQNFTAKPNLGQHRSLDPCRPLKVGFIAHSLYEHSVGWLSRWLFKHFDRQAFNTFIYLVNTQPTDSFFQQWFSPYVSEVRSCSDDIAATVSQIVSDQVDILIDLEGQTQDYACSILALKPAPIQATWLGWDATGLPSVDYFIADPYVLPEDAQNHYTEKIWRLPQTYIAVEGFETGVPDLRRDDLNIPIDAIIYLTCQASCKRHPDSIRWQMQILKQVPGSYLLVKGQSHTSILQDLFCEIAESEGVAPDRLRFLPQAPNELIHRANLQIADVVLDTFPYNGATTTLETLWMGIPTVTCVGGQFTARYGYTLLTNAGLTEGIAWSDQEYVDWGIRYGTDPNLRLQVAHKLRQSRHNAPLWDAKKFVREMENACRQMWQIYTTTVAS
jgi:predicted O-linked N-acetylglucosamine transferase (SPINDLY family)